MLSPEGLRQRQRDGMSPRGRFAKAARAASSPRDGEATSKNAGASGWTKIARSPSPEKFQRKKQQQNQHEHQQDAVHVEHGENRDRRTEAEDVKGPVVPDGGSAGREGRQFTVAKVGINGRIYLRPSIRTTNQQLPQPSFVFPVTPPSTAGLDALAMRTDGDDSYCDDLWTPSRSPTTPQEPPRDAAPADSKAPARPARHKRSHSYSTVDEQHVSAGDLDAGVFKIVIERAASGPKTTEFINGVPTLVVPIPTYKLGTPRFSTRGTAFLRSSAYTLTDDVRSSVFSHQGSSHRDRGSQRPARILSRRHSDASPQPHFATGLPGSPNAALPATPNAPHRRTAIIPEMFDGLTFKPSCDEASVVRYSMSGAIKAATPARLVAEITSPTFVDYDLLSDFFLTFRSFLETADLLYMLISRLMWALSRKDETGTVVRVRTFVAIRHWILNYFLDDFVVDYDLRKAFCDLLNNFVHEQTQDTVQTKVPLKILGELKKCWRRVCALYWDGPEFDTELGVDVPILPGGVAGSRNPNLDPSFWVSHADGPPRLDGIIEPDFIEPDTSAIDGRNFFADVSRAGYLDSIKGLPTVAQIAPPESQSDVPPLSPTSIMSEDFVSCSFPSRYRAAAAAAHPIGAHPVVPSSAHENGQPIAMTPKALTGKRVRPAQAHKRSGSFSDSFRDQRVQQQPVQKVIYKSTEILLALPYAGSLVRGNLFPPGQAFVDVVAPSTPALANRATTLLPGALRNQKGPSAMSGPGMKRLLGSVRRALSNRAVPCPSASPTQGSFPHIPPLGIRGATINRLPGTAVVPQARPKHPEAETPMRIDLLGAEIAEDFKKAVQEDADADAEAHNRAAGEPVFVPDREHTHDLQYSMVRPDDTLDPFRPSNRRAPVSEMTNGSKSIVIVDDTPPFETLMHRDPTAMTEAVPTHPSVDNFAEPYMHPSGDPTPPSTPPGAPRGTPRRSSHLLGQHSLNRSLSLEGTPSLVFDSRPSRDDERSPSHRAIVRPSIYSRGGSYKVTKSLSLRRYASYHSGCALHRSERSFDASTLSEQDGHERLSQLQSVPLPLRVLRRRPGGDLRAVTNVGDLNAEPLRRPASTGSITVYSDSVRSSYLLRDSSSYVEVVPVDRSQQQEHVPTFSLGALAEKRSQTAASLFSTHSSKPVMRPSFEKEAQILAQIPDDEDDDGGVESALLKLEGKYDQRRSDISSSSDNLTRNDAAPPHNSFGVAPYELSTLTLDEDEEEEKRRHRHQQIVEKPSEPPSLIATYRPSQQQPVEALKPTVYKPRGMHSLPAAMASRSVESYNSIPLLDRGLTDDEHDVPRHGRNERNWSEHSILRGPSIEVSRNDVLTPASSNSESFNFIDELHGKERILTGYSKPKKESIDQSFLESESNGSDLSSELSLEVISRTEYTEHDCPSTKTFPPIRAGTVVKEVALPSHPLRHTPSPPMRLTQALKLNPSAIPPQSHKQLSGSDLAAMPPTPDITPILANPRNFNGDKGALPSVDPLRSHHVLEPSRKTSVHLPFILAFDSHILAQQFTLIEKDALNEIDWKDLIEMRWKDRGTIESRSWVEFLRTSEPRGVEVVIARFNIMVKWAVSEVVLTNDIDERARCLIKYIHIAAQCRKFRNFATMTQITVALTSKDVARLTETWAYVPAADVKTLSELEALVTPTGNFHNLRAEMEGSGADQGCIPFVGIYTHDLLVNSERPSQIASTPTAEPLINFERCRTDATIVKNLLRLLEASQLYRFLPIEGVTERCLWMAALGDNEIAKYGSTIQQ